MNLGTIGFKSFYKYWRDADGNKAKGKTLPEGCTEITKDEYDNDSGTAVVAGASAVGDDAVHDGAPGQTESTALVPVSAGPVVIDKTDSYGPANFQDVLKRLDTLIGETTGISQLQMDEAREYVVEIMTTLKVYPEFEGILVDKDVHNVMVFVQSSSQLATADFITRKEKKATAASKKAKAVGTMQFDMIAFEGPIAKDSKAGNMDFSAAFGSLDAFASLNVDGIEAKDRRDGKK